MPTLVQYRTGTQAYADGTEQPPQVGRQGQTVVDDCHARYYQLNFRSSIGEANSFVACTAVAGTAPGTVLSTTPPFILWNPPSSGKNLFIIRVSVGYVSGTLGLGQLWYAAGLAQIGKPTTGTVLPVQSTVIGNLAVGAGQAFQASTLVAVPSPFRPSPFNFSPYAGGGAVLNPAWVEELGGTPMVAPGGVFCIQAVAGAGSTPLMTFGVEWGEEKST